MIPTNLDEKQAELLIKNQEKRAAQNSKNASGPRKKANQPTERTRRSAIPGLIIKIRDPKTSARDASYLVYQIDCIKKKKDFLTYCEFFKQYQPKEDESNENVPRDFRIKEMAAPNNQVEEHLRQAESPYGLGK